MKKPIIGIVSKPVEKYDEDLWNRMDIVDELRYLIVSNGGIAISLLSPEKTFKFNDNDIYDPKKLSSEELKDIDNIVKICDGIILQGGLVSCNYEIEIAKKCIEYDIPLIGICAGFNNILRALGTDVIEDKTQKHNIYDINYRHKITIKKDTILYNSILKEKLEVNSIHSMIAPVNNVQNFAKISSYSEDGLVESFELENKKFIMGIKWHPELMLDNNTFNLFKNFINACNINKKEN